MIERLTAITDTEQRKPALEYSSNHFPAKIRNEPRSEVKFDSDHRDKIMRVKVTLKATNKISMANHIDLEDLDREIEELDNILTK